MIGTRERRTTMNEEIRKTLKALEKRISDLGGYL
jgi:hypothetical protein